MVCEDECEECEVWCVRMSVRSECEVWCVRMSVRSEIVSESVRSEE